VENQPGAGTTPRYVSVKFDPVGRARTFLLPEVDFDPALVPGEPVVVQIGDRKAYGAASPTITTIAERTAPTGDRPMTVVRRASRDDVLRRLRHEQREREAKRIGLLKIRERGLPMKLVSVEQLFDDSKLVFSFTAEGRVDFRQLVRELASEFRVRIEMRQIGSRDEAKLLGGYGTCGRPLCCTTWLQSFEPISIKMAKRQHLSLNPSRLSGACGRLKCCLRYELPNAKGEQHAGCAHESSCERSAGGCGGGCGGESGGCSDGGCGSCGSH
jgi:cell fate regulator YaaT (PSP1 superfamily)